MLTPMRDAIHDRIVNLIDTGQVKEAQDVLSSALKNSLKEDSFLDGIIEPVQIGNNDLHPQLDTETPVRIEQRLPDSPGAAAVPFLGGQMALQLQTSRFAVYFYRIQTPAMWADVDKLRTHVYDIRQHYLDQGVKDIGETKDTRFIQACNTIVGTAGSTVTATGVVQHANISGGITRSSVMEALKTMNDTPNRLEPATCLVNVKFAKDILKWKPSDTSDNISEAQLREGQKALGDMFGYRWLMSIKRDIIPDNQMFMFAGPDYLGRHYVLQEPVMWVKTEPTKVAFGAYTTLGFTIGNVAGVCKATFS